MSSKQSTLDSLQKKGWVLADIKQHALANLHGKSLNSYRLLVLLGPRNRVGARYFQIFSQTDSGGVSHQPAIIDLHNQGEYPHYNWIEIISFMPRLGFGLIGQTSEVAINELAQQLVQHLADLIPPGDHMMVEYDSPEQQNTAHFLALGIPQAATPLGYMLFSIGCDFGFKDWYFAEGGSEGSHKLQGYTALNSQHAQLKIREMVQELMAFLERTPSASSKLEKTVRDTALAVLSRLKQQNGGGTTLRHAIP